MDSQETAPATPVAVDLSALHILADVASAELSKIKPSRNKKTEAAHARADRILANGRDLPKADRCKECRRLDKVCKVSLSGKGACWHCCTWKTKCTRNP